MLRTTALVLAGLCFSGVNAVELKKCSAERKWNGQAFQKVYKQGLVWSVNSVPKDTFGHDLYIQTEKVGDKHLPWLNKNLIYAISKKTLYGLDCHQDKSTYLCRYLCNPDRDRSFIVVFGHKTTREQQYRVNLVKEAQGEGEKPKVFLKSIERASTKGDTQLKFTIQRPRDPVYFEGEEKPAPELAPSHASLLTDVTWEQMILHGTQEQEMEKLVEKSNGKLQANAKGQEKKMLRTAQEQENAFFAQAKAQEGKMMEQKVTSKFQRRRLLEAQPKIQC
jgi:hypothetical protein